MKNVFNLFIAHVRRISKNKSILLYFIGMPIFMFGLIFLLRFIIDDDDSQKNKNKAQKSKDAIEYSVDIEDIGLVVHDKQDLWMNFFDNGERFIRKESALNEAKKLLKKNEIIGIIVVNEHFSEDLKNAKKPKLDFIQMHKGNGLQIKINQLEEKINAYLLNNMITKNSLKLNTKNISGKNIKIKMKKTSVSAINIALKMFTLFVLYIIMFGSSAIVTELIKFRESKLLTRTIASPNSEISVILSFLLSFVFLQVLTNFGLFIVIIKFFEIKISGLGTIFITILSTSIFALSLAIVLARIFNKAEQISLATTIISILTIMFFLLAFTQNLDGVASFPPILKKLAIISPLYWLMEVMDKGKFFPNLLVVWLMIIALITAGSWRLKEFNKVQ